MKFSRISYTGKQYGFSKIHRISPLNYDRGYINMDLNFSLILYCGLFFIPFALIVAWIVSMENAKFFQRIDQKISVEILKQKEIDDSRGLEWSLPNLTLIRHNCKKENRYLFLILFIASLVSFFGGSIFVIRDPLF